MKTLSKFITALAAFGLCAGPALAQKAPDVGFIRIVNAIGVGQGNAHFSVNGEDLWADGYLLGQATGGLGYKAGGCKVEAKRDGVETGMTNIDIQGGETLTLIAFAEKVPPVKEDDPPKWTVKLLRLKQSNPEKGYRLALISVSNEAEVKISVSNLARNTVDMQTIKRLALNTVDLGRAHGEAIVKVGETALTTVSTDAPGNYVVILYEDGDGKLHAINFFDPKFVIAG